MTRETLLSMPPDELIKETLRLDEAATPGPWRFGALAIEGWGVVDAKGYQFAQVGDGRNGCFIAYARTAARIHAERERELRAEVERLRDALQFYAARSDDMGERARAALSSPNTTAPRAEA